MGEATGKRAHWRQREQVKVDGQAVKAARVAKGLSREDVASKLGCSYKTVERIETNNRPPGRQTVLALMELLGLTLADLGADLGALLPPHARPPRA